ncbi:hypothetical protein J6590_010738 [Homalodisca vitripennis]|nr:hypothetical protein J6590_010738 [Homalodisca vitripennis]
MGKDRLIPDRDGQLAITRPIRGPGGQFGPALVNRTRHVGCTPTLHFQIVPHRNKPGMLGHISSPRYVWDSLLAHNFSDLVQWT